MKTWLSKYPALFPSLALGGLFFLSLTHHLLQFWERPALVMLGSFALGAPILAGGTFLALERVTLLVRQISKGRFALLVLFAALLGAFAAWQGWHIPADYQTLTLTPLLTQGQTVTLVEIKAGKSVVPLEQEALDSGWKANPDGLIATIKSQPVTVSFRRAANLPVTVLLLRAPSSGGVQIDFEGETVEVDLRNATVENTTLEFSTRYRGLPNGFFLPALFLVDLLAFGTLTLGLLLAQEAGERARASRGVERFPSHRVGLSILLGLGFILHLLNFLATPLILDADSPTYLQGAIHWLKYGNLDGISVFRGPVTTFLFTPILWAFGRSAWGMKVLLKLAALACIPLGYRLGWQLGRQRFLAFLGGLAAVLTPDMYVYSNFVMSDLLNLLVVLIFSTLLLSALEQPSPARLLATLLTGSLAALLRSENLILFGLAVFYLTAPPVLAWIKAAKTPPHPDLRQAGMTALLAVVATLPLVWWAGQVQRIHGIFSLGNHPGIALYDGWVYYGDASKLSFSDPESPAMQKIRAALEEYPAAISDKTGAATSLEVVPSLEQAGYSELEIYQLLEEAALDSIRKDWTITLKLFLIKMKSCLRPEITHSLTYSLPGEPAWSNPIKAQFFDAENVNLPMLIGFQRAVNETVKVKYPAALPWVLFCLFALTLSLLRRPAPAWTAMTLIVATRIFIPATLALSNWRFTLGGWIPLQIIAVGWIVLMAEGLGAILKIRKPQP